MALRRVHTTPYLLRATNAICGGGCANVPPRKVLQRFVHTKSGPSGYENLKNLMKMKWDGLGERFQLVIVESLIKASIYAIPGGGGAYLMKRAMDRIDKVESAVISSNQELSELKALMEIQSKLSIEMLKKWDEDNHQRFLQIQADLSELKILKDIWFLTSFAEESAKKPGDMDSEEGTKKGDADGSSVDDESAKKPGDMDSVAKEGTKKGNADGSSVDDLMLLFEMMDKDGDGYISLSELYDALATWNKKLVKDAGYEVKGSISFQELQSLMGK